MTIRSFFIRSYRNDISVIIGLVKNKTPEEREKRRGGIQKTELVELKERLAKTEAALTKLMEATNMISEKMNPDGTLKPYPRIYIEDSFLKSKLNKTLRYMFRPSKIIWRSETHRRTLEKGRKEN